MCYRYSYVNKCMTEQLYKLTQIAYDYNRSIVFAINHIEDKILTLQSTFALRSLIIFPCST